MQIIEKYVEVKRYARNQVSRLQPQEVTTASDTNFADLPLVLTKPAEIIFCGGVYLVEQDGLYVFSNWDEGRRHNVIMYRGDDFEFFSSVSRLHLHGRQGDQIPKMRRRIEIAKQGRLALTCGGISSFTQFIVAYYRLPLRLRRVEYLSRGPWNHWDNGHILLEYWWPQEARWILIDLDTRVVFRNTDGNYLNAYRLACAIRNGQQVRFEKFCHTSHIEAWPAPEGKFSFYDLLDGIFYIPDETERWYQRIAQIPFHCEITFVAPDGTVLSDWPADREQMWETRHQSVSYAPLQDDEDKLLVAYNQYFGTNFAWRPLQEWLQRYYTDNEA